MIMAFFEGADGELHPAMHPIEVKGGEYEAIVRAESLAQHHDSVIAWYQDVEELAPGSTLIGESAIIFRHGRLPGETATETDKAI